MKNETFIKLIASSCILESLNRSENNKKWVLPSVATAQSILESGYGTTELAVNAHALFAIKANNWKGESYVIDTAEYYNNEYVTIKAAFRKYNSWLESVSDYYKLITENARYSKACNVLNYTECITAIKNGGYATAPDYINKIINIIDRYDLYEYDNIFFDYANIKKDNIDNEIKELKAGDVVQLNSTPCYNSAYDSKPYGYKSGIYYVHTADVVNNKIRITNLLERVGVVGQVTCWIDNPVNK